MLKNYLISKKLNIDYTFSAIIIETFQKIKVNFRFVF